MDEELTVESRIAPPPLSCPKCDGLLPSALGDIQCDLCNANVRTEHDPTRTKWMKERISCPSCSKVLIAGIDETGTHLFETCPSANFYEYKAMAIGAKCQSAKTYLEKNFE